MPFLTKALRAALALTVAIAAPLPALAATGPFPTVREVDPSLRYHVLFRPVTAKASRIRHPVVVFAGGGCRNAGARFSELLGELASHGYFVIALGEIGDPAQDVKPDHEPEWNGRPTKTDVSQIDWAVKWAREQTSARKGRFAGLLDTARITLMGQSCGGVQAIDAASRLPGISTLVVLNSGLFADDRSMGGTEVKRADLAKVTVPTLILLGGKGDVAYENGQANFDLLTKAPVLLADADFGHRATYFEKDGGLYGTVVRDWLNWKINASSLAAARFTGENCGLCTDKRWRLRRRGI
ncbi:MAG: hypothetical protein ACKOPQ_11065 [Novosphingobium sp.]